MASAIPVLPLVASISVSPGRISPRASARRIMDMAARSLTEPAGLLPSSFARMTLPRSAASCPGIRCKRRSEEHTSELQSREKLVCRLLLEKKKYVGNLRQRVVDCEWVGGRVGERR